LADDNPPVLAALGRMLQADCDVIASVSSGSEAVGAVSRLRPDVLVTDLMMSDMDGLEVCRRVKRLTPGTAVIIMTAAADPAVRAVSLRDGASALLPKHLVAQQLVQTIERVCTESQKLS